MTFNLAALRREAAKVGATVEDERIGTGHRCEVFAPKGKRWEEGGVHSLVEDANRPFRPDYIGLFNRMRFGLCDCPDVPFLCDVCCEEVES